MNKRVASRFGRRYLAQPKGSGYKRPNVQTVGIAPSLNGREEKFVVILEKEATYEKPFYMIG